MGDPEHKGPRGHTTCAMHEQLAGTAMRADLENAKILAYLRQIEARIDLRLDGVMQALGEVLRTNNEICAKLMNGERE